MEKLTKLLSAAIGNDEKTPCPDFYTTLATLELSDEEKLEFKLFVLPQIYMFTNLRVFRRDIIYLSLLANKSSDVILLFLEYESKNLKLKLGDASTIFDFCYHRKKHWFLEVIEKNIDDLSASFPENLSNKVKLLKLIYITNAPNIKLENTKQLLSEINFEIEDTFLKTYVEEVKQLIGIVEFINIEFHKERGKLIYDKFLKRYSFLEILSQHIDLKYKQFWERIGIFLENRRSHQEATYSQSEHVEGHTELENFNVFVILYNIIDCLRLYKYCEITPAVTEKANEILKESEERIFNLKSNALLLETIENIFSFIFMRNKHLDYDEGAYNSDPECYDADEFFCDIDGVVSLIVSFLKAVITEIESKQVFSDDESERFARLKEYVLEAGWRVEIVSNNNRVLNQEKPSKNIIPYLLAPPESLVNLCLKQNDFQKADQVFERYKLKCTPLANEIANINGFQVVRQELKAKLPLRDEGISPSEVFQALFQSEMIVPLEENDVFIKENLKQFGFLSHYLTNNNNFINILDITLTLPDDADSCSVMLKAAEECNALEEDVLSPLSDFHKRISKLFKEVNNQSIPNLLNNPYYNLDVEDYKTETAYYKEIGKTYMEFYKLLYMDRPGTLNPDHESHKVFMKLQEICTDLMKFKYDVEDDQCPKYFSKVMNYLRLFSKVYLTGGNHTYFLSKGLDTPYFDILSANRSRLIGKLVFKRSIQPSEFASLYKKVKLDLVYNITANCFPDILLYSGAHIEVKMYLRMPYVPNNHILSFINNRNWLLGYIVNELHKIQNSYINANDKRVKIFNNFIKSPIVEHLKVLYDNNEITTALHHESHVQSVIDFCKSKVEAYRQKFESSLDEIEAAQEMSESMKVTEWLHYLDIIDSISEVQFRKYVQLAVLRDSILYNIVVDKMDPFYYKYVRFMWDNTLRVNTILREMKYWQAAFCLEAISAELSNYNVEREDKLHLQKWYVLINLQDKLTTVFNESTWFEIHKQCQAHCLNIIHGIMATNKISILIDYITVYKPPESVLKEINLPYLESLFVANTPLQEAEKLFSKLPHEHVTDLIFDLIKKVRKLDQLEFLAKYLHANSEEVCQQLKCLQVSLKILSSLHAAEQDQLYGLIFEPIAMLEVLIMNTRLDKLGEVVNALMPSLNKNEFDANIISTNKIDQLLRKYAEKSLDFRVITQPNPRLLRTVDVRLLQSLDSVSSPSFTMPDKAPDKKDWVPDSEVLECMCCQKTAFSMFNRRHHCRRCGRVICFSCSTKRLPVESYGNVLVRVCLDCYDLMQTDSATSTISDISTKSLLYDYWYLGDDKAENAIIREEFSFEHAPSVSLCLAILKHHSESLDYPEFLLSQCEKMLKLLKPVHLEVVHEIDYPLVIKMLKSLIVAAKIKAAEYNLPEGVNRAEKVLKQADLYMLLAEKGRLNLLAQWNTDTIDATILRRVRDKLLEDEQWQFALEVSTKAGLDISGVFAAWGKSCLKAGSFQTARQKLVHCFDRVASKSKGSEQGFRINAPSTSKPRTTSVCSLLDGKPLKNPPLLMEIIDMLESMTTTILNEKLLDNIKNSKSDLRTKVSFNLPSDNPVCILSKLKNCTAIASGLHFDLPKEEERCEPAGDPRCVKPFMDTILYEECLHYLTNYGSHSSLVKFYLKHGDFNEGLKYLTENNLSSDVFIEIYVDCLRNGVVNILLEYMSKIDPSLQIWGTYIQKLCKHLQIQSLYHSLYQLQLYMGDFIRASMSCLRFYTENVSSLEELSTRNEYLKRAEKYLRQASMKESWANASQAKSSSSIFANELKLIVDQSLIMRLDPKQLDRCLMAIVRQIEAVSFLAKYERKRPILQLLPDIVSYADEATESRKDATKVPTLFDTLLGKIQIAVLVLVCGENVKDGFELCRRIIEDCKLKAVKVYCQAAKLLVKERRFIEIPELVRCIRLSELSNITVRDVCDEVLVMACRTCKDIKAEASNLDNLAKLIEDPGVMINTYIECGYLKSAYTVALRHNRFVDIRRIMHEAELTKKPDMKRLCQKTLDSHELFVKKSPFKTPTRRKHT